MKNKKPVGLILAAGLGNRLRPSTLFCPKPLIPVAGIEPLYFALYQMQEMGLERVIINAHYLHQMLFQAVEKWRQHFLNLEIRISNETAQLLGTGGAILKVVNENRDWFVDAGLLVQNGDTLPLFDQKKLFEDNDKNTFSVSKKEEFLKKYGPVWLNDKDQWVGIGREPKDTKWKAAHFFGAHFICPRAIKHITRFCEEITAIDLFNGIYRPLNNMGENFYGVEFDVDSKRSDQCWFDITNKEYLLEAQAHIMSHVNSLGWNKLLNKRYPGISEVSDGIWIFNKALKIEGVKMLSPTIFINTSTDEMTMPKLSIGPDACWIQEKSLPESVLEGTILSNSIVFLKKDTSNVVPSKINDEVLLA